MHKKLDGTVTRLLPHSLATSLTRYLTHSLPHSLATSLTRYLTHSLPHSLATSLTRYLTHSLPHSLATSLTRYLTHSQPHSLARYLMALVAVEDESDTARRVRLACESLGLQSALLRVPSNYYELELEERRALLNAPSIHNLCKTILMEVRM